MVVVTTAAVEPPLGELAKPLRKRIDVGGVVVCGAAAVVVILVLLAPVIAPYSPITPIGLARSAPSFAHPFGIDQLGRDVLSRTLWGGQQTLFMAVTSTLMAAVIGTPIGIFAGYVGGVRANVSMRVMDVLLAFPGLLLALVIITIGGSGVGSTILAVGVSFIPVFARVIYGATQRVRAEEYISASIVVGASTMRVMTRNVLPVVLTEVLVLFSSAIGWTTLLAASLNFLGFGVAPPTAEWGADLGAGSAYLNQAWWISAAPGFAITVTILLANFLGDFVAKLLAAPRADAVPSTAAETGV